MSARRVVIDPNVRVRGNQTFAAFDDVNPGPFSPARLRVGESVEVVEPESGLSGTAEVTSVDLHNRLVYLAVDWRSLRVHGGQP